MVTERYKGETGGYHPVLIHPIQGQGPSNHRRGWLLEAEKDCGCRRLLDPMDLSKIVILPLMVIIRDPVYLLPPLLPASVGLAFMAKGHLDQRTFTFSIAIQMFMGLLSSTIIIAMAPKGYQRQPSSITRALPQATKRFPVVLGAFAIIFVVAMAGFLLLIVPGIIVLVFTFFAFQEAVLSQKGPIQAIKESVALVKAHFSQILFLFFYLTSIALFLEGGASKISPFVSFAAVMLVSPYVTLAITFSYLEIKRGTILERPPP